MSSISTNTIANATQRSRKSDNSSARVKKKKNRLNRPIAAATAKKTLPVTPLRTSAVTSDLASSTSARTSVERWVVTSRTSSPTDCSPDLAASGASGIEGSTGGTSAPPGRVELATAVLLHEPVETNLAKIGR